MNIPFEPDLVVGFPSTNSALSRAFIHILLHTREEKETLEIAYIYTVISLSFQVVAD
jgi:hypothetical protein